MPEGTFAESLIREYIMAAAIPEIYMTTWADSTSEPGYVTTPNVDVIVSGKPIPGYWRIDPRTGMYFWQFGHIPDLPPPPKPPAPTGRAYMVIVDAPASDSPDDTSPMD